MNFDGSHLAYCTNIHPAESWAETFTVLASHVLAVRDRLRQNGKLPAAAPFAIGLRLSAVAASELLEGTQLREFRSWLQENDCYVFTINGFPYGSFHGTRVKELVFKPDWTDRSRLDYTKNLFRILAVIALPGTGISVSTLPGSHKTFHADEALIRQNLNELAVWLEELAAETGHDFHLGLEPEPLGHIENTAETLLFFERLLADAADPQIVRRRIGVNFDTCHFAIEFDEIGPSLDALHQAGIRLSKIHLSSALAFDPQDPTAVEAIRAFDEPTYFHQVLVLGKTGEITHFVDLPDFLNAPPVPDAIEARVHFHIPLDAEPRPPLRSTHRQVMEILAWRREHPQACRHYEIETYTWGVLPGGLQRPVEEQLASEYAWVIDNA